MKQTTLTLPPYLMTSDPGSYARATILERKPRIIYEVIQDNNYSPEIISALGVFLEEIKDLPIKPLIEHHPDIEIWNSELSKYPERTWLEVPWYFAEAYFYRKLLEAVSYFQNGQWLYWNPFHQKKEKQIQTDIKQLVKIWDDLQNLDHEEKNIYFCHAALWANRTDLSNFTVNEKDRQNWTLKNETANILIDDSKKISELLSNGNNRIDFINDNAGSDIFFDLVLCDFLITSGSVNQIVFHLKNQPFFVSDAMPEDIYKIIELLKSPDLAKQNGNSESYQLGEKIQSHLLSGKLMLKEDMFWTSPFMFDQMPAHILDDLKNADLVILKGDVNYRRLLGDRHWPFTTSIEEITEYFTNSFITLRTLKSEILVGLDPGIAESQTQNDPNWLINGKRGIIQLVKKSS